MCFPTLLASAEAPWGQPAAGELQGRIRHVGRGSRNGPKGDAPAALLPKPMMQEKGAEAHMGREDVCTHIGTSPPPGRVWEREQGSEPSSAWGRSSSALLLLRRSSVLLRGCRGRGDATLSVPGSPLKQSPV